MNKTDILVNKDFENSKLNEKIKSLQDKIDNLNLALGSKEELLKWKDAEIKKIKEENTNKEKVIIKQPISPYCSNCGNSFSGHKCPICGTIREYKTIETRNLDEVYELIRKEATAELKKTISELEDVQLDLEIKIEKLENALKREKRNAADQKDEIEVNTRKRYNKIIKGYEEEIEELKALISDMKKNRTKEDKELINRIKLDVFEEKIKELTRILDEEREMSIWKRIFYGIFGINKIVETEAYKYNQLNGLSGYFDFLVNRKFLEGKYGFEF